MGGAVCGVRREFIEFIEFIKLIELTEFTELLVTPYKHNYDQGGSL